MATFIIDPTAVRRLAFSPGVALTLQKHAEAVIVPAVKRYIDRPYPGTSHRTLNPPPGPVYRRTGDLRDSVQATFPTADGDGFSVGIVAPAVHRGMQYADILVARGYNFTPPSLGLRL